MRNRCKPLLQQCFNFAVILCYNLRPYTTGSDEAKRQLDLERMEADAMAEYEKLAKAPKVGAVVQGEPRLKAALLGFKLLTVAVQVGPPGFTAHAFSACSKLTYDEPCSNIYF